VEEVILINQFTREESIRSSQLISSSPELVLLPFFRFYAFATLFMGARRTEVIWHQFRADLLSLLPLVKLKSVGQSIGPPDLGVNFISLIAFWLGTAQPNRAAMIDANRYAVTLTWSRSTENTEFAKIACAASADGLRSWPAVYAAHPGSTTVKLSSSREPSLEIVLTTVAVLA